MTNNIQSSSVANNINLDISELSEDTLIHTLSYLFDQPSLSRVCQQWYGITHGNPMQDIAIDSVIKNLVDNQPVRPISRVILKYFQGDEEGAKAIMKSLAKLVEEESDIGERARSFVELAKAQFVMGNLREATKHFDASYALIQKMKSNVHFQVNAFDRFLEHYIDLKASDTQEKIEAYIALVEKCGDKDSHEFMLEIAKYQYALGNLETGKSYVEKAIGSAEKLASRQRDAYSKSSCLYGIGASLLTMAKDQFEKRNLGEGNDLLKKAMKYQSEITDTKDAMRQRKSEFLEDAVITYKDIALIQHKHNNVKSTQFYLQKALLLTDDIGSEKEKIDALKSIILTQIRIGDLKNAKSAAMKLNSDAPEFQKVYSRMQRYIAAAYVKNNDLTMALEIAKVIPSEWVQSLALKELVQISLQNGKIDDALASAKMMKDPLSRSICLQQVARQQVKLGSSEVLETMQLALEATKKASSERHNLNIKKMSLTDGELSKIVSEYNQLGETQKALLTMNDMKKDNSTYSDALIRIARAQIKKGQLVEAKSTVKKMLLEREKNNSLSMDTNKIVDILVDIEKAAREKAQS